MRWVIVAIAEDGSVYVIGPGKNRTYRSSEAARKDADQIERDYDNVQVLPLIGITD